MTVDVLYMMPGFVSPDEEAARARVLASYFPREFRISTWFNAGGPRGIASQDDTDESLSGIRQFIRERGDDRHCGTVVLGCFVDPGLDLLRGSVKSHVIGAGESSLAEAFARSDRVGILTTVDSIVPVVRAMVQQSAPDKGGADRTPIIPIGLTGPEIRGRPEEALARCVQAAARLRDEEKVSAVCLGCMGFSWSGVGRRLQKISGLLHFVDPLAACAEALIRSRKEFSVAHE
jgi:allantoin racemase